MKRLIALSLVLVLALIPVLTGCDVLQGSSDRSYTIQVVGTEGLEFSGTYEVTTADGVTTTYTVEEGIVPAEYDVIGKSLSCQFGKTGDNEDLLHVAIVGEGELIAESQSSDPYGVVIIIMQ